MENEKKPTYYPRKMRVGWCVAHEVTVLGITIERYGMKCTTYRETVRRVASMNVGNGITTQQEEEECKKKQAR